jgi:polyisoprenoid-binding protein YceI
VIPGCVFTFAAQQMFSSPNFPINMKIIIVLLSCIIVLYTSCKKQSKTELSKDVTSKDAVASYIPNIALANEKYIIEKKESLITWKGSMAFASKGQHTGYIDISRGVFLVAKDQLVGGTVEVDMNTIADERHDSDNELVKHLKSPDFFDAMIFPITTFTITKIASRDNEYLAVTGNLTIKGITHEIIFPAKVEVKGEVVNANGKMTIDRAKWDVRYNSGKFYDHLADEAISDSIEFDMKIVAKKKPF